MERSEHKWTQVIKADHLDIWSEVAAEYGLMLILDQNRKATVLQGAADITLSDDFMLVTLFGPECDFFNGVSVYYKVEEKLRKRGETFMGEAA